MPDQTLYINQIKVNEVVYNIEDTEARVATEDNAAAIEELEEKHDHDMLILQGIDDSLSGDIANIRATHSYDINMIGGRINDLTDDVDEARNGISKAICGLVVVDNCLYGTDIDGNICTEPITGIGGGGGGGGGGYVNAVNMPPLRNGMGGVSQFRIAQGSHLELTVSWSSTYDNVSTGEGMLFLYVNNILKYSHVVDQGDVTVDVKDYVSPGKNTVRFSISDSYGNTRNIQFIVKSDALSITSTFDTSRTYSSAFLFPYILSGGGGSAKTISVRLDGTLLDSTKAQETGFPIPALTHGPHSIEAWFSVAPNGEYIESNHVYYEFIFVEESNNTPIIVSNFAPSDSIKQYDVLNIPYRIYRRNGLTTQVTLKENGTTTAILTVDRTEQVYTYNVRRAGTNTFSINVEGVAPKTITFNATGIDMSISAVEGDTLALHLSAEGRNNSEDNPDTWTFTDNSGHTVTSTFTNFNHRIDGWQKDNDGFDVLRLCGDARLTINYNLFSQNFIEDGKTIEIEFATREVYDYLTNVITCWSDGKGLKITPQQVIFKGNTEINTLYKDNEHIRLSIVVSKQTNYRLILIYINGLMSRAIQYSAGEDFDQGHPVPITIGSNDCGVDIYNIRIYNEELSMEQIKNNWIADTQNGNLKYQRYSHNDIYDIETKKITPDSLPLDLPYMVVQANELPQFKGDKKSDITGYFVDKTDPAKSFDFTGCQMDVQGTSSAPYYRKNYDMKFNSGFDKTINNVPYHLVRYKLKDTSVPFNRFVLKADVASSESANNTGLTSFFNDTCPYKTDVMRAGLQHIDSKGKADPIYYRHGIEGRPIVLFWYDNINETMNFMGKYNFNLPKRAPNPLGYAAATDEYGEAIDSFDNWPIESWEWQRNNSANMKFQDVDFESVAYDEMGMEYPAWYDDFEARMPSDEYRDVSVLREMLEWVYSTYREQATNATLSEPKTYVLPTRYPLKNYASDSSYTVVEGKEGNKTIYTVTFTKDTPAYRLCKFRAECADYFEMDSAYFYYLFTETFLMIDSRAKNMFIGFKGSVINNENRTMTRKAVFEPYDMDTAVGTNNSGVLMFGYSLEDVDHVSGIISGDGSTGNNAPVFNAQDSVFWCNLRDAFYEEIAALYISLRTSGAWSYEVLENMFETHQSKWPEAVFNEDAWTKYIVPLVDPVTVDEETGRLIRTDRYLTMLQGSKKEQRKWWLYNRFKYLDSKFVTGSAVNNEITIRLFNRGTITLTPAMDMYVSVRFGAGTTPMIQRTTTNTPVSFEYSPGTGVQEMETLIQSGDMITDVGDLSVFYPNEIQFGKATKLKRLKIGDSNIVNGEETYSNANLTDLDVHNSSLLEYIDVRNCPNLTKTIDLSGSPRLKEAYFEGSSIAGVDLVDGGAIETLHLPGTITSLALLNLFNLEEIQCPDYSNVTRLMLANIDTDIVDPAYMLQHIKSTAKVNIQGIDMECEDAAEIEAFLALLDGKAGFSREKGSNGEWIYHEEPTAQVSGEIHTTHLTGNQIASYNTRYPYLNITADHTTSVLTYKTWDGSETIYTETIYDGANGTKINSTARTSDVQFDYTPDGWSTTINGSKNANALNNVVADRTVYAAYSSTVRKYNITFKKDAIDNNNVADNGYTISVEYGKTPVYPLTTPTSSRGTTIDYPFIEWNPAIAPVTGEVTYVAVFGTPTPYTVTYMQDDGITVIYEETVLARRNGVYNTTPSKTSTAQYNYTFRGWATTLNGSVDSNAQKNVTADRTLYAVYTSTVRTYPVVFKLASEDGGTTLYPTTGTYEVAYGNTPVYGGIPTDEIVSTRGDEYVFEDWSPTLGPITGATTYTVVFYDTSSVLTRYLKRNLDVYESNTATVIGDYAFYAMPSLTSVKTSALEIGQYAFTGCSNIEQVELTGDGSGVIKDSAFQSCNNIKRFIIRSNTMYTLNNINAFTDTGRSLIYVPDVLVETYKSATIWKDIAYRIYGFGSNDENILNRTYEWIESEITDSDEVFFAALADGTAKTKYKPGQYRTMDLGTEGIIRMQIVDMNVRELADSTDTADIEWVAMNKLKTQHRMNPALEGTTNNYVIGTGSIGGMNSNYNEMQLYLDTTIWNLIPQSWKNVIKETKQITRVFTENGTGIDSDVSISKLRIPSYREINAGNYELSSIVYKTAFADARCRIRDGSWVTRTASGLESYYIVNTGGSINSSGYSQYNFNIILCFST